MVPSERATAPEAAGICAKAGLELMSLDSITQLDSVQDFLGDIGSLIVATIFVLFEILELKDCHLVL